MFYGGRYGRETSSSEENDDPDPSYLPSQEEMEALESDESHQDESDGELKAPPLITNTTDNSSGSRAIAETTAWSNIKSNSRSFSSTATKACHFANELPSDHEIEPIDIYKISITDEVLELIVTETIIFILKKQ